MYDRQSPFVRPAAPRAATLQKTGAAQRLRDAILRCELAPGERVSEARLCSRFGFGKAAVRDALSRLEAAGLVTAQPRSGWAVAPVSGLELAAVVEARRLAEAGLAALRPDSVAAAGLSALAAVADATAAAADRSAALRAERLWRDRLAALLSNALVARWLCEVWDRSERIGAALDLPLAALAPGGRAALTEAIARGDGKALVRGLDASARAFEAEASLRLLRAAQFVSDRGARQAARSSPQDSRDRADPTDRPPGRATGQGGADG